MSNLVRAIWERKRLDRYISDKGILYELLDDNSFLYENIAIYSKNKSDAIEIHYDKEIAINDCIDLIVSSMKIKGFDNIYCSVGYGEKPLIIKINLDNLKAMLGLEEFNSKCIALYSIQLDGCLIVDLPTLGARDFGVSIYGQFSTMASMFRSAFLD